MKTRIPVLLVSVLPGLFLISGFIIMGDFFSRPALAAPRACIPSPHKGPISSSQEWCLSDSPHILEGDVTVWPGITLTIEAGTVVLGANDAGLLVQGHMEALGTPAQPITFTSVADSGSLQWAGLAFEGGSGDLRHATVRYAGDRNSVTDALLGANDRSLLAVQYGALRLEDVTIEGLISDNFDYGLIAADSLLTISGTLFTGIGGGNYATSDVPVRLMGPETVLEMSGCIFSGNVNDRVLLDPGAMMGHDTRLAAQPALDGYEYRDDYTVPPSITLTLEPGVTFISGTGGWNVPHEFTIQGRLQALGTPSQPITFTSVADSGPGQWPGLIFDGGTGYLRHATVRYAGDRNHITDAALGSWTRSSIAIQDVTAGEVRLEDVTIRDMATGDQDMGIYAGNSNLVVENSFFTGIGDGSYYVFPDTPIYIAGGDSQVTLTGNTFTGNHSNTVVLRPGAMMNHDTSLVAQIGLDGYVLQDDFTVPVSVTLTIEPGVTVRGGSSHPELRVEGHLDAMGLPAQPITFTSFADSGPNQWAGLVFDGSRGAGAGVLRYATVRYGGRNNSVLDALPGYHSGANVTIYNVTNGEVRLEHAAVKTEYHFDGWHRFVDHGIYINSSRVVISDSTVEENCDDTTAGDGQDSGIYVTGASQVSIEGSLVSSNSAPGLIVEGDSAFVKVTASSITNNIGDGVRNTGAATVVLSGDEASANAIHDNQGFGAKQEGSDGQILAAYNWWGDASGPTHTGNPTGSGEGVSDGVLYEPWLTQAPAPPTVITGLVQLAAPNEVSVGQTVNLGVFFQNILTQTLDEAILVLEIPWRAEYQFSTHGGQFWPLNNHVIWKLGDVAPGATFSAIAQVRYRWGTPNWTVMPAIAMAAAANLPNEWVTYADHFNYEELVITSEQDLSQAEVDAILSSDATLEALFNQALGQGFDYYGNATLQTLSDGAEWFEMLLMDVNRPGEMVAVRRIGEDRHLRHETESYVSIETLTGGASFDFNTTQWTFWGDMQPETMLAAPADAGSSAGCEASSGHPNRLPFLPVYGPDLGPDAATNFCPHHDWGDCLRNCLINQIPREMTNPNLFGGSSSCNACVACDENCLGVCSDCARGLWKDHQHEYYHDCTKECADSSNWNNYQCDEPKQSCYDAPTNESPTGRSQFRITYACDGATCNYLPNPTLEYCPNGCIEGDTLSGIVARCKDCTGTANLVLDEDCVQALTAHDPNALYGPQAAAPGQIIEYTVEWENEGEGSAYGVYVESRLPAELDESTLQIGGNGVYFPGSRTLMWEIGELGPGAGDHVTYSVQVPISAVSGTVMVAEATVYFPSVPETTPTNPVVTIVQNVSAASQLVETDEGLPAGITLTGYSPSANPLVYTVSAAPENGVLSGSPPDLVYLPAANFEGMDAFEFTASDGMNTSLPAVVTILVNTAAESSAPQVLVTSPYDGDVEVVVYPEPLYDNVYAPAIWAQFNEPIDPDTLTVDTFYVEYSGGRRIAGTVGYDATNNKAIFTPNTPLTAGVPYKAVLTAGVKDTSGNRLAENYIWRFRSGPAQLFMPYIAR